MIIVSCLKIGLSHTSDYKRVKCSWTLGTVVCFFGIYDNNCILLL